MNLFHRQSSPWVRIAKTGFLASLVSYLGFALAEVLRPGFVARYFSLHLFLLAALIFGFWWGSRLTQYRDWRFFQYVCAIILGAVLLLITWRLGQGFAEYRILMALLAAAAPLVFIRIIRSK